MWARVPAPPREVRKLRTMTVHWPGGTTENSKKSPLVKVPSRRMLPVSREARTFADFTNA